jgi:polyhydroxyalkanoate synthase subunit PhaC
MFKQLLALPDWMAATPAEVIWQRRSVRLLRYRFPEGVGQTAEVPLFLVPSMINRHYVMDLMKGHSLVEHLLSQGLAVYLIDWGRAAAEDRYLDFDYCIEHLLGAAVERACRHARVESMSVLGYCMGATMAAIYAALHPRRVANLINLAGPIDFTKGGALFQWTDERWFNPDLVVDALGNIPALLMQGSFSWLVPTSNAQKLVALIDRGDDKQFMRIFTAIEKWTNDNVPFPGEAYRKYIRDLFQKNLLMKGELQIFGKAVRLEQITSPVLVLTASRDHIVPAPSAVPLTSLCGSKDATAVELPGGHVGIVVGSGTSKHLWPTIDRWLLPRSRPKLPAARPQGAAA